MAPAGGSLAGDTVSVSAVCPAMSCHQFSNQIITPKELYKQFSNELTSSHGGVEVERLKTKLVTELCLQ